MISIVLMLALIAAAVVAPRFFGGRLPTIAGLAVRAGCIVLALFFLVSTSFINVPADKVGVIRKIYGGRTLEVGRVIAADGETGFQARILTPGFHFSPAVTVINAIELLPMVTVPTGFYGRIVTLDGDPLPEGQIMADAWPDAIFQSMLDAEYFMKNHGQKGLQASILKPGRYPLNLDLYQIKIGYAVNGKDQTTNDDEVYDFRGRTVEKSPLDTSITKIPAGFVGVVRSTISEKGKICTETQAATDADGLSAKLVPPGCKGIWSVSLQPGDYYLNKDAYDVIAVDTRVQALEFKGGYTRRYIDLAIDSKGDIVQSPRAVQMPVDPKSSDDAVTTKVEGWEVPQELRAQIQVKPENAPIVVAAVGTLAEIEKRIIIPGIRSIVRNVAGGQITVTEKGPDGTDVTATRPVRVLDLVNQRPALEAEVLRLVEIDARRAGVDVKEIRYGEAAIPPELLVARQREQLAGQLRAAYVQEQVAQEQRQKTEQARATADQQSSLVTAQIAVQVAKQNEERQAANGRAERRFLEEQAAGQQAQTNVLGKDSVLQLNQLKLILDLLGQHPEILKGLPMPSTLVVGSGGLEGPAAMLAQSLGMGGAAKPAAK